MITTSKDLKEKYDNYYSDNIREWRQIGAIGKVKNILDLTKGLEFKNVVEVGAGDGSILSLLSQKNICSDLTAVEISESAVRQIEKRSIKGLSSIVLFDGYNLPFSDNQFDLAICSHVIEHVEYPRKLLREIKRISKKQVFEIPIDFSLKVDKKFQSFNSYGHINIFTPALFDFLLYSENFKIIKSKSSLFNMKVVVFQNKRFSTTYFINIAKRLIWRIFPPLMRLKPNTYTVLTE